MGAILERLSDSSIYLGIALIGTVLYLVRLVLMFAGGHHGGDFDVHVHDGSAGDHDSGMQIFSLHSILAFAMGFGWMGLLARGGWGWNHPLSLTAAVAFGTALMLLSAFLMFNMMKLQSTPSIDMSTTVGTTGKVYLTIPAKGQGEGQVEIAVSGRKKILPAVSTGAEIASFTIVTITGVDDTKRLIVEARA